MVVQFAPRRTSSVFVLLFATKHLDIIAYLNVEMFSVSLTSSAIECLKAGSSYRRLQQREVEVNTRFRCLTRERQYGRTYLYVCMFTQRSRWGQMSNVRGEHDISRRKVRQTSLTDLWISNVQDLNSELAYDIGGQQRFNMRILCDHIYIKKRTDRTLSWHAGATTWGQEIHCTW